MLQIKGLSKAFGNKQVIRQLDLDIPTGSILAVVGPSGGGKTTFLRILAGLEKADAGSFVLDGKEMTSEELKAEEQIVGVVFQDFQLFPHLSVFENITLAPKLVLKEDKALYTKKVADLAKTLGISELLDSYPFQLSGGQKQRVALARAMAMSPKILAYDEPTSALDPALRQQVEDMILSLKKEGVTQIVVTHDLTFAKNIADHLLEVSPII
ncbi:amino acid ABC transporter ATP-binding protein [Enterococcus aquimarinus]|uniref:ATP-binding cassette domain-containing protein n=1 Tax=Enterococcus aquimarinus TaxID=328396 RepID=A0A1L8QUV0_9ENTE|nr:ATP-binding cassette domain-containing protein [Enterococcus aquimarinus]MBP6359381.1 amino acid ABC transporter ATP-binding protein [Enterococcus sp.]MBP7952833.1 amino acid ABC transporter ATP-binding protein [Enterococcus sp.]MBP8693401.1 amino acid ABC transporter ATP-binding protein [Enterococcus sp.]MBP9521009.1 amino acid ABC transporter ATP-binding protein [Enterococcus sp.]MCC9274465.1 ATP-binding cassette domain-containing protein [Enterococcus aquimarinus]